MSRPSPSLLPSSQVIRANDVKIYNLSAGKSLPEWLDERKRRALVRKDVGLQKRIQLLQDFDMPIVSTKVSISRDGQYIMALGEHEREPKRIGRPQRS